MVFITIIAVIAYFVLPLWGVMWFCYEKHNIKADPFAVGIAVVVLEFALFCQIIYSMGFFNN
jgi:hypothetical protein